MAPAARIRGPRPERVAVQMYRVGFGDCFLVSFHYAKTLPDGRDQRHMLVDFGSTHAPKGARGPTGTEAKSASVIERAAERIREHTGGQLDVVVNTHRHRDHLSGFGDPEAAAVIASLHPRLVVRAWTEDPELSRDATAPALSGNDPTQRFAARLAAGQELAARVEELSRAASEDSTRGRLAHLALDQVPNKPAIDCLDDMAKRADGVYLSAGMASGIEDQIPGIRVRVLGPPTLDQLPAIAKARANDPDEFWLSQRSALETLTPDQLDPGVPTTAGIPAGPVGWIVDRLAHQQVGSLARIVRTVDDALNNTSLILLLDAGDKRLLLPGDAQIENWSWALFHAPEAKRLQKLLSDVDLYKVGHHGSRNATPRSLFRLWGEEPNPDRPMTALLSTMAGVHGRSDATAVPRGPLVEALARRMTLVRTDERDKGPGFVTVAARCDADEPFTVQPEATHA